MFVLFFFFFLLTFINTDSLNFSLLIIFIATFLPSTQWTPNLTSPAETEKRQKSTESFKHF